MRFRYNTRANEQRKLSILTLLIHRSTTKTILEQLLPNIDFIRAGVPGAIAV